MSNSITNPSTRIDLDSLPSGALLTSKEAASALSTPEATLNLWRHRKTVSIPYVKIGGNVRYRAGDLVEYIKKQTVVS